jgi:hypothetical protein
LDRVRAKRLYRWPGYAGILVRRFRVVRHWLAWRRVLAGADEDPSSKPIPEEGAEPSPLKDMRSKFGGIEHEPEEG